MTNKILFFGLLFSVAAPLAINNPADAQQLTSGDLEQCKVFDEEGELAGFDSVCLAEKRAALRDLQRQNDYDRRHWRGRHGDHYYNPNYVSNNPYPCPAWANNGTGYATTVYTDGGPFEYIGIFDSPLNGVPCHPNPVTLVEGF